MVAATVEVAAGEANAHHNAVHGARHASWSVSIDRPAQMFVVEVAGGCCRRRRGENPRRPPRQVPKFGRSREKGKSGVMCSICVLNGTLPYAARLIYMLHICPASGEVDLTIPYGRYTSRDSQ